MADYTSLINAATDVILKFNAVGSPGTNDYAELLKKMEHNVTLKRVLFPDSVHGIGDVTGYLNFHMFGRKPRLADSSPSGPPPYPPYSGTLTQLPQDAQNATSGQVTGTGYYVDDNGNTSVHINFSLGFVRKNTAEQWSWISGFAILIP